MMMMMMMMMIMVIISRPSNFISLNILALLTLTCGLKLRITLHHIVRHII